MPEKIHKIDQAQASSQLLPGDACPPLLSEVFRASYYGMVLLTLPDCIVVEANDAFASLIGEDREAILGRYIKNWGIHLEAPPSHENLEHQIQKACETNPNHIFESRLQRQDNGSIDVRLCVTHLCDAAGHHYAFVICRDISKEKQISRALAHSETQLRALFDNTRRMIDMLSPDGKRIASNKTANNFTGPAADTTLGQYLWECPWWRNHDRHLIREAVEAASEGRSSYFEINVIDHKDRSHLCNFSLTPIHDEDNNPHLLMVEVEDISQTKQLERELLSLLERSPDGIVRYDKQLRRVFVNSAFEKITGLSAEKLISGPAGQSRSLIDRDIYLQRLKEAFRSGMETEAEVRYQTPGQKPGWAHVRFMPEQDESTEISYVLAAVRDITEMVESRQEVQKLAFTDPLTRLANRHFFKLKLEALLREGASPLSLLILDVDNFKEINDSLGHTAGDEMLQQIASRLQYCIRGNDLLARLGGDEFALVFVDYEGNDVKTIAQRLLEALTAPFQIQGQEVFTSASIGIAHSPNDGVTLEELTANADTAMYEVKKNGRHGICFYTPELSVEVTRRLSRRSELRTALEGDQFQLLYQPKIRLTDQKIVGAEALLRWQHPSEGLLSPDCFIDITEESGLIIEIGKWVLDTACRTVVSWNSRFQSELQMAVNLSPRQFYQHDIAEDVRHSLLSTGCRAPWLECEITEGLLLRNEVDVHQSLSKLQDMGVSIAIDDFGTGHSALSYLHRFPVNTLKIDRSFVAGIEHEPRKATLANALVSIGKTLNLNVVAEGIETETQAMLLNHFGYELGQGYLIGKPMPDEEFQRLYATI